MTFPQVQILFEYWRKHPLVHDLTAWSMKYRAPQTVEEQWAEGAMGPADFARWVELTGGRSLSPRGQ